MSSRKIHHSLLTSFPTPEKKERKKWRKKREKKRGLPRFREFCFSFFSSHGRIGLDPFQS
jgi:hypothetical protein